MLQLKRDTWCVGGGHEETLLCVMCDEKRFGFVLVGLKHQRQTAQ